MNATREKSKLTIAIPTFNRAAKLQAQLDRLLPQLTAEVQCQVYDNASTDETPQVLSRYSSPFLFYLHLPCNFGGERNMLRCFDECRTEWLWVLSDDDPIAADAVASLLALIQNNSCDYIHVSSPVYRPATDVFITGVDQLLEQIPLSTLMLVSQGIYKMSSFRPVMRKMVESISTGGPRMVALLALLESGSGRALFTPVSLIVEAPPPTPRWSTLDFIIRFSLVPDYLDQPSNKRAVAETLWRQFVDWALVVGLREAVDQEQIRRWMQVRKVVPRILKGYGAQSPWFYVMRNWFRAGHRKESLSIARRGLVVCLIGCCPRILFRPFLKFFPFPSWVKEHIFLINDQKFTPVN